MSEYFPEPNSSGGKVNVELDLSNYATKADFKNASLKSYVDILDIDTLKNVPCSLSSLKSKVDKIDIRKLETTPVESSKLSNAVKNVVKKTEYNAKIKNIEDKIPDTTNLATKTTLNAKINEVKEEIPSITNLATTASFIAVENKTPNISNSVKKKTDYNTKNNEITKKITDHDDVKYITTPEVNKLTAEHFAARLAQANLPSKSDIVNFVKKKDFEDKIRNLNKKCTSNKKHLLVENQLKKLQQTFDSSLLIGQSYFSVDGAQFYLILILNQFTKLLQHFLVFKTQSQNGI